MTNPISLTLSVAVSAGLSLSAHAFELNDTGLGDTDYSTNQTNYYFEGQEMTEFPGQDPEFGRDAAAAQGNLSKVGGGRRGFDFSDHNDCVKDNVTGLVWEVKTNASHHGLQSNKWTYSWYDDSVTEYSGRENGGICHDKETEEKDRIACDTAAYVAKMNEIELCGYKDWRLPQREELRSIADYSQPNVDSLNYEHILPSIDQDYFPNTLGSGYWTGNVYLGDKKRAWTVDFEHGGDSNRQKNMPSAIRLVSDAEKDKTAEDNANRYEVLTRDEQPVAKATMSEEKATPWNRYGQTDGDGQAEAAMNEAAMNEADKADMDTADMDKADMDNAEDEPGVWDKIIGVFDDDETASMEADAASAEAGAEAEAESATTQESEAPMEAAGDETPAEDEPGFFDKVKSWF